MSRTLFLTLAAAVALAVGATATLFPAALLASKGTVPSLAANVWMRETGVLLLCLGLMAVLVRRQPDSPTLRAVLLANLLAQLDLLATEWLAWANGVITQLAGLLPNTVLHVLLAAGFAHYARRMRR